MSYDQKPKNAGSIYINTKKGTAQNVIDDVAEAVKFLREQGVRLSISVKNAQGNYDKMTGFFNDYKRPDSTDPDMVIRLSEPATRQSTGYGKSYASKAQAPAPKRFGASKPAARPQPQQAAGDGFAEDGVPFE